jgi:hypothetical protein
MTCCSHLHHSSFSCFFPAISLRPSSDFDEQVDLHGGGILETTRGTYSCNLPLEMEM